MTRRSEIMEESEKHMYDWGVDVDRFDVPDIFAKGAEWADRTMIDKACEWLMLYGCEYATEEVMVEHFRKAMEE